MLRRLPILLTASVLLAAPATAAGAGPKEQRAPAAIPGTPTVAFSSDRVIVQWAPGANRAERAEARAEAETEFATDLGDRAFQLVEVERGQTAAAAVRSLEADPAVAVAERDSYRAPDAAPNDPLFGQLWGLRNTGAGIAGFSGALAGADIDVLGAWARTVGDPGIVVADIDSGYRFEHPDLAAVTWTNPGEIPGNGNDDDSNGVIDDVNGADFIGADGEAPQVDGDPTDDDLITGGHGVHTAGTIAAAGDDAIGVSGVAQDVSLMPLRVCSRFPDENKSLCSTAAIVAAINYAAAKGARVANLSLGSTNFAPTEVNAIAAHPETLYVVSAGNDGTDNDAAVPPGEHHYPCDYEPTVDAVPPAAIDNVLCVAATDQADGLAGFSNWGATSVDLGAPGTEILSTYSFTQPLTEDFSGMDFALNWPATGVDGGFERSDEGPLTSFGTTDAIGAPAADSERETTSTPVTVAPNAGCRLSQTRHVERGADGLFRYSVLLDGTEIVEAKPNDSPGAGLERRFINLPPAFNAGGEVRVRFRFTTGADPEADSGVWLDDISISCAEPLGQSSGYAFLQGTSMAAPQVSGAAALLFSLRPSASVTQVREALLAGVDPVASLAGKTVSGGRLDASRAMDALEEMLPPPVVVDPGEITSDPLTEPPPAIVAPPASIPPPVPSSCTVPKLTGKTLARAKAALAAAGCWVRKVSKPKARKGVKAPALVVKASSPRAGATATPGAVSLTLGSKPKPPRH